MFLTISLPFLSDFQNNGTTEFSEFFCVGWAIENKFLELKNFGGLVFPMGFRYLWGLIAPKSSLQANLMFNVGCSKLPTPKMPKIPHFHSPSSYI